MRRQDWIVVVAVSMATMLAGCSRPEATPAAGSAAQPAVAPIAAPVASPTVGVHDDEPRCTDAPRADQDDKRPRCGGMGVPQGPPSHAYRVVLDNGESFTTCDIGKPFNSRIAGGSNI